MAVKPLHPVFLIMKFDRLDTDWSTDSHPNLDNIKVYLCRRYRMCAHILLNWKALGYGRHSMAINLFIRRRTPPNNKCAIIFHLRAWTWIANYRPPEKCAVEIVAPNYIAALSNSRLSIAAVKNIYYYPFYRSNIDVYWCRGVCLMIWCYQQSGDDFPKDPFWAYYLFSYM